MSLVRKCGVQERLTVVLMLLLVFGGIWAQAQTLDAFNPGANHIVSALAIQSDGKVLVGGDFTALGGFPRTYFGRLNSNGTVDTSFTNAINNAVNCLLVQADGRIIVGGRFTMLGGSTRNAIGRLFSSGTFDSFFNPGVNASLDTASVAALALQPDGKILLGGRFNSLTGFARTNVGRLHSSGVVDITFNAETGSGLHNVQSLALQSDGKILIGGAFTNSAGSQHANIIRLHGNGIVDTNFNPNADGMVTSVAVQPDGRILVGGEFTRLSGQARSHIGRLNPDGSLDAEFDPGASGSVLSLALQADGKILVGGTFTNLAGQSRNSLGRLNSDGSLDADFNLSVSGDIAALAIQVDGKIVVGGSFTNLAGLSRSRVGRINNTDAATQTVAFNSTSVTWLRGGTSPEVWRANFELSTNGMGLFNLGAGTRIADGWQLTGLALPANVTVRARGFITGGEQNGSGWFVETIYGAPVITSQPAGRTVDGGSTVTFTVSAMGSAALRYQWRKNGVILSNGGNVSGAQNSTLVLINLSGADAGEYSCIVSNNFGAVPSAAAVLQVVDPRVTLQPNHATVQPGGSTVFNMSAVGSNPLSYQWRKNGIDLPGETASALTFSNIQYGDAGARFDAVVTNTFGRTTSAVGILSVNLATLDEFNAGPVPFGANIFSQVIQPDGRIVVGGGFQKIGEHWLSSIARLSTNGAPEPEFNPDAGCCGGVHALALQPDGRILAAGHVQNHLGRLNSDGTWNTAFNPATAGTCAQVNCLALQPDGKILVGGSFNMLGGQACTNLGRLNPNGTLDTSFRTDTAAACSDVYCIALQPDGKILYGGEFGPGDSRLVRLHPDGERDASFTTYGPATIYEPNALVVQPDGKILVAAWFPKSNGQTDFLGRLNPDGTLVAAFNPGIKWSATIGAGVQSMALQSDGKILLGGQFYAIGDHSRQYLARLNSDGTADPTFAPLCDREVYSLGLQSDGKIVVGGHFSSLGGQVRSYLGRLDNTIPASQKLLFDGRAIMWQRGGASPEVWRTTFEFSTTGANWISLGTGERVPGGWSLSAVSLPTNAIIRARGFTTGGQNNASTWFVETTVAVDPRTSPQIIADDANLGFKFNKFGFRIAGLQGQVVVVESSSNLVDWMAFSTNSITSDPIYVSDPDSVSNLVRFYRARLR